METTLIPFISRYDADTDASWIARFRENLPEFEVVRHEDFPASAKTNVQVAIVAGPKPERLLEYPKLEWVASTWAGVEGLVATAPPGVGISRLIDPELSAKMGEAVLTAVLALHRHLPQYARQQAFGEWRQHRYVYPRDRTVGILGLGELGRASIDALTTHDFKLLGWSRSEKEIEGVETYAGAAGYSQVLAKADILVCLLPLTEATEGLLGASAFAKTKPGTQLINFARGAIVDDEALLAALDSDHIDHAVLDVFALEPLPSEHPYWNHPRVTVLPHISALTDARSAAELVAKDIKQWFLTGQLPQLVNRKLGY